MAQPLYTGITTSLNYRIKKKVQKRISIVHRDREVEVLHRLLDGIAYALSEAHEIIQYDNKVMK